MWPWRAPKAPGGCGGKGGVFVSKGVSLPVGSGEACHGLGEACPRARAVGIQNKDEEPVVEDKDGEVLRPNLVDDKDSV